MKISIFFILFFLSSSSGKAALLDVPCEIYIPEMYQVVLPYLKRHTVRLERSLRLYHWASLETSTEGLEVVAGVVKRNFRKDLRKGFEETFGFPEGSNVILDPDGSAGRDYFKTLVDRNSHFEGHWMKGHGFYAAVDPIQSQTYAGRPLALVEISLGPGMVYLDLLGLLKEDNQPSSMRLAMQPSAGFLACLRENYAEISISPSEIFAEGSPYPFMEGILRLYAKDSAVYLTSYGWGMSGIPVCQRRGAAYTAFYFFSDEILKDPRFNVRAYTSRLPELMSAEGLENARQILEAIDYGTTESMNDFLKQPPGKRKMEDYATTTGLLQGGLAILRLSAWNKTLARESWFEKIFPEVVDLAAQILAHSQSSIEKTESQIMTAEVPLLEIFRKMKRPSSTLLPPDKLRMEKWIETDLYACTASAISLPPLIEPSGFEIVMPPIPEAPGFNATTLPISLPKIF